MAYNALRLVPPFYDEKQLSSFLAQNKTVNAIFNPRGNSLVVFPSANLLPPPQNVKSSRKDENDLYFVKWDNLPACRRRFYAATMPSWAMFREEVKDFRQGDRFKRLGSSAYKNIHDTANIILNSIEDQLKLYNRKLQRNPDSETAVDKIIMEITHSSYTLAGALYVPEHGFFDAPIGTTLSYWINTNFPFTEISDGEKYLQMMAPWQTPGFWTFMKCCLIRVILRPVTVFLSRMAEKTTKIPTREVAQLLITALNEKPDYSNYSNAREEAYFEEHRKWKAKLYLLRRGIEKHKDTKYEGKNEFEDIAGLVEGKEDVLYRICTECSLSWRDALCAWGIWIHPHMSRKNVASFAAEVIEELPVDSTHQEDLLLSTLFTGKIVQACKIANDVDAWLACHLTDLFEALVIPGEDRIIADLRDHFMISYAENLMTDPSLWRVAITYLSDCGKPGLLTAEQIITHLAFRIPGISEEVAPQSRELAIFAGTTGKADPVPDLDEVLKVCVEFKLGHAQRSICRIAAKKLTDLRQYGKAVEYLAQTGDWQALKRVASSLLNEYLMHGAREFVLLVDQIPSQYLYPPETSEESLRLFTARLHFPVLYAEFHHAISQQDLSMECLSNLISVFDLQGDLAPETWWGLILTDIGDLLAKEDILLPEVELNLLLARLEDVSLRTRYGAGKDYLWALMQRYQMKTENEALQRLERVRFTMVHATARSMISSVGGKGPLFERAMTADPE